MYANNTSGFSGRRGQTCSRNARLRSTGDPKGRSGSRAEHLRKALDDALHASVPTLVEVDVA